MTILKAKNTDLDRLEEILNEQRQYLKEAGIPQWQGDYPNRSDFENDINLSRLFVIKKDDIIVGFFALVYPDHNYDYIEDGKWLSDTPYIAIHRMGITNQYKGQGIAGEVFNELKVKYNHLRIDTHILNNAMNKCLIKNNFTYCGVVYMEDNTKRNAYEWVK